MGDPVQAFEDAIPLPQRIGRYRILCELGTGSMAALYLARMTGLGRFERLFAVKVIHHHLSKERAFVEMFMNEARIAAKIQHPNVIPVYEIDVERGRYYMVMDYVSGETLALLLKNTWNRDRPFPVAYAAQVIASACEGLHAAHELRGTDGPLGVVHRDVAPQNLMIGYDGIVRVMDFGIAKALDTISNTTPGTMKGTIAYMAPEQVRCRSIDRRVDIFALGTILWESTVGMRLFRHKNDVTTAARVLRMQVPPPSTLRKDYPIELERIVMKALQRDPEQRYQTAREMGEDLAEFLHESRARVTPATIGEFMSDVFADQLRRRQQMELLAREVEPPADLGYMPADISADSLRVVNEDAEVELEDLEGTHPFKRSPSGPAATLTITSKLEQVSQKGVPTLIVRARDLMGPREEAPPVDAPLERAFASGVQTLEDLAPAQPSVPKRPLIAGVTAAVVLLLIALLVLAGQKDEEQPIERVAAQVEPPAMERERPKVEIRFAVTPANAEITVDGARQHGTLRIPQSNERLVIRASAEGYVAGEKIISADSDQTVELELAPVEREKPAIRKPPAPRPRKKVKPRAEKRERTTLLFDGDDL